MTKVAPLKLETEEVLRWRGPGVDQQDPTMVRQRARVREAIAS